VVPCNHKFFKIIRPHRSKYIILQCGLIILNGDAWDLFWSSKHSPVLGFRIETLANAQLTNECRLRCGQINKGIEIAVEMNDTERITLMCFRFIRRNVNTGQILPQTFYYSYSILHRTNWSQCTNDRVRRRFVKRTSVKTVKNTCIITVYVMHCDMMEMKTRHAL